MRRGGCSVNLSYPGGSPARPLACQGVSSWPMCATNISQRPSKSVPTVRQSAARELAPRRKCRINAVPMLAGLSLSLASGPAAAICGVSQDLAISAPIARPVLYEEEIFDVRLTTFRVFDGESANAPLKRPTMAGAACGACGADLYYPQNSPAVGGPRSIRHRDRSGRGRPARRTNTIGVLDSCALSSRTPMRWCRGGEGAGGPRRDTALRNKCTAVQELFNCGVAGQPR
jgi:hypothetical protein